MLHSIDIKGTFHDAIEITAENLQEMLEKVGPIDMQKEITDALSGGETKAESVIYYASWRYPNENESRHYVLFPNAGRGGVCDGGYTSWTDANTLDELEDAYDAGTLDG